MDELDEDLHFWRPHSYSQAVDPLSSVEPAQGDKHPCEDDSTSRTMTTFAKATFDAVGYLACRP